MQKIKKRCEVRESDKWDLSRLYKNEAAWQQAVATAEKNIGRLETIRKKFSTKAGILAGLDFYFSLSLEIESIYSYAQRKFDEDLADNQGNVRLNRAEDLYHLFHEKAVFIDTILSQKSAAFLRDLAGDKKFRDYSFFLENISREKKHLLSEKEETILAQLGKTKDYSYNIFGKLNNSDLKFADIEKHGRKIKVSQANFNLLLHDPDREVRRAAKQSVFSAYRGFRETLSQNLFQHIKNNVTFSRIRKYPSTIAGFSFSDDLQPAVYENLFAEAAKSAPLLQRYCRLKKKALGYKKLYWHDLYVPLVRKAKQEFSYEQAADLVLQSVKILGKEYEAVSRRALLKERWVDRYPNLGKRSGAYSSFGYETPPYILMNFNGSLDSVSTLAHELGHSLHTYLAASNNPYSKFDYPIFLAEIASTFNEQALAEHLLYTADRRTRLYIIDQELEKIRLTFFRQALFAEFEKRLYEEVEKGGALTADFLEREYLAINRKYYGASFEQDELLASEWSRIPHFFYNFYVYKYSTGLAIANYFFERVKSGDLRERDNYLKLLKAGGSDFPAKLLLQSGLDIYRPEYLRALMDRFASLLDELEKELGLNR